MRRNYVGQWTLHKGDIYGTWVRPFIDSEGTLRYHGFPNNGSKWSTDKANQLVTSSQYGVYFHISPVANNRKGN